MKCPLDQTLLVISERSGIEIDYCPECRGVWLDRGELDKIVDRAGSVGPPPAEPSAAFSGQPSTNGAGSPDQSRYDREHAQWQREEHRRRSGGYDQGPGFFAPRSGDGYGAPRRKKKENWLSELFD
ncbi:hypothetical protein GCM10025867_22800 [Frondihabitans sucicola]|uniref:Transcription factor zinc-finger domain-containing protein n=1 Tax=Frondihabitans sucicola TaxID=1268041 RepID=A0ABM8GNL5_9MICO|nr:zf-TFIIB domain-containing protein [Frondihabitans sucicola]BDZ50039.1 hypothetical protein GCM10025867_22800 [Frondihabitans sucicola]